MNTQLQHQSDGIIYEGYDRDYIVCRYAQEPVGAKDELYIFRYQRKRYGSSDEPIQLNHFLGVTLKNPAAVGNVAYPRPEFRCGEKFIRIFLLISPWAFLRLLILLLILLFLLLLALCAGILYYCWKLCKQRPKAPPKPKPPPPPKVYPGREIQT